MEQPSTSPTDNRSSSNKKGQDPPKCKICKIHSVISNPGGTAAHKIKVSATATGDLVTFAEHRSSCSPVYIKPIIKRINDDQGLHEHFKIYKCFLHHSEEDSTQFWNEQAFYGDSATHNHTASPGSPETNANTTWFWDILVCMPEDPEEYSNNADNRKVWGKNLATMFTTIGQSDEYTYKVRFTFGGNITPPSNPPPLSHWLTIKDTMTIILDTYQDTFIMETDVFNNPDIALKYYLNDILPTAHNIMGITLPKKLQHIPPVQMLVD